MGSAKHEAFIGGMCPGNPNAPDVLKIITYNIAAGRGAIPNDEIIQDKLTTEHNLKNIADFLKTASADIVFLQEVDFSSKRTHYINEAMFIAEKAGYPCYACVTNWVKNYIPYPDGPPSRHFGRMKSGQCILSKYPIRNNQRIALPQRKDKPFYYTAFYYDDAIQSAIIDIGGKLFKLFGVHQEAIDIENKEKEVNILVDEIKKTTEPYVIAGGDFNAVPPIASLKKDFPDLKDTPWADLDITKDKTMEYFVTSLPNFSEAIPTTFTTDGNFTFPSNLPNRRLDYIFFSGTLKRSNGQALNPGPFSDHRPLYVEAKPHL